MFSFKLKRGERGKRYGLLEIGKEGETRDEEFQGFSVQFQVEEGEEIWVIGYW